MREPRSAPAKKRRRRGARRNDFLPKSELSRGKPRPLATQLRVLRLALDGTGLARVVEWLAWAAPAGHLMSTLLNRALLVAIHAFF